MSLEILTLCTMWLPTYLYLCDYLGFQSHDQLVAHHLIFSHAKSDENDVARIR